MVAMNIEPLIERIYDLGLDPEQWPRLIGELANSFGGHAASLEHEHLTDPTKGAGAVVGLDPAVVQQYFDHYAERNILRRVDGFDEAMRNFKPVVTVDQDTMPKSDLIRTEFYADFLRPAGIHSVLTLTLRSTADTATAVALHRPIGRAAYDYADLHAAERLLPHLVRALRLSQRVAEDGRVPSDMAAALDRTHCGMIIVSGGKVRHANAMAEALFSEPGGLGLVGGSLVAASVADTERLRWLIGRAQQLRGRTGGSATVRRLGGRPPLSVSVSPLGSETFSILRGEPAVLVCITDPAAVTIPDAYLRDEAGLTAAEARLARLLVDGKTLRGASEDLDVSYSTVRSQLLSIFEKTGANRQAELVALLMRQQKAQVG
jgi:DNA-binding CsgD family transcriptional regulator